MHHVSEELILSWSIYLGNMTLRSIKDDVFI